MLTVHGDSSLTRYSSFWQHKKNVVNGKGNFYINVQASEKKKLTKSVILKYCYIRQIFSDLLLNIILTVKYRDITVLKLTQKLLLNRYVHII
jgi:hypothetical protein